MAKVAVYRFETYDAAIERWSRQPHFATMAYIESVRGAPQLHTKTMVEEALLTPEGLYTPIARS